MELGVSSDFLLSPMNDKIQNLTSVSLDVRFSLCFSGIFDSDVNFPFLFPHNIAAVFLHDP